MNLPFKATYGNIHRCNDLIVGITSKLTEMGDVIDEIGLAKS